MRTLFFCLLMALMPTCKSRSLSGDSATKDLAWSRTDTNVTLILGAPTNLSGVSEDLKAMESLFTGELKKQKFQVRKINHIIKKNLLEQVATAAKDVGRKGTLVIYFSGHGTNKGLLAEDMRVVTWAELSDSLMSVRETPIKRLIFLIDSCYSGAANNIQNNRESAQMAENLLRDIDWFNKGIDKFPNFKHLIVDKERVTRSGLFASNSSKYAEILILTSSTDKQTSLESKDGGIFTRALRASFSSLSQSNSSGATIKDLFIDVTERQNKLNNGSHKPVMTSFPSDLPKEKLFEEQARVEAEQENKKTAVDEKVVLESWMKEVLDSVNSKLTGCKIGATDLTPGPSGSGFMFSPSFFVVGREEKDQYIGVLNWMSDPSASVDMIVNTVTSGRIDLFAACQRR